MSTIERPLETVDDASLFSGAMEPEQQPEPTQQEAPEPQDGQPRDEHGRFAPKAAGEPEQVAQPQQAEPAQADQQPSEDQQAAIPSWRLKEVADERRAAVQRAEQAEIQARHYAAQLQQMNAELEKLRNPPAKPPDFFESPEAATQAAVQAALEQMVAPQLGQIRQTQLQLAQAVAATKFGDDKVKAADEAFSQAVANRTIDQADYHRVMNSPNVFAAAVDWHNRQQVMSTVGPDPEAWFNKRMETFLSDPKNQATVMERIRGQAQNGSRPNVQLPPSLGRAPAAASAADDDTDVSDAALFRYARR